MLSARQCHQWLFSMGRTIIICGWLEKCQKRSMAWAIKAGWTKSFSVLAEEELPEICCREPTPAATIQRAQLTLWAWECGVRLKGGSDYFCLPPHTTQDSQSLDCTVFGPLKRPWTDVCHDFQQQNPDITTSKLNFSPLFTKAWLLAIN